MATKLYVGNLPFSTRDQALTDLFGQFGTVESVRIITDRETGRSKGFAFVEMSTEDEANAAIEKLNGSELEGRAMTVSEARPMAPREQRTGGGGPRHRNSGGGGDRNGNSHEHSDGDRNGNRGNYGNDNRGGNRSRY